MIRSFAILGTALAVLPGCASTPASAEPIPSERELLGDFGMGDGLGLCQGMELRANHTFTSTHCGAVHIGGTTWSEEGQWQLQSNHIFFYDKQGKYGNPGSELTYAEIFYFKDAPAFVLAKDLKNGSVHELWVFHKRKSTQ